MDWALRPSAPGRGARSRRFTFIFLLSRRTFTKAIDEATKMKVTLIDYRIEAISAGTRSMLFLFSF